MRILLGFIFFNLVACAHVAYEGLGPNFNLKNPIEVEAEINHFTLEYSYIYRLKMGGEIYKAESLEAVMERVSPEAFRIYLNGDPKEGINYYNKILRENLQNRRLKP